VYNNVHQYPAPGAVSSYHEEGDEEEFSADELALILLAEDGESVETVTARAHEEECCLEAATKLKVPSRVEDASGVCSIYNYYYDPSTTTIPSGAVDARLYVAFMMVPKVMVRAGQPLAFDRFEFDHQFIDVAAAAAARDIMVRRYMVVRGVENPDMQLNYPAGTPLKVLACMVKSRSVTAGSLLDAWVHANDNSSNSIGISTSTSISTSGDSFAEEEGTDGGDGDIQSGRMACAPTRGTRKTALAAAPSLLPATNATSSAYALPSKPRTQQSVPTGKPNAEESASLDILHGRVQNELGVDLPSGEFGWRCKVVTRSSGNKRKDKFFTVGDRAVHPKYTIS
jgi:hypothetical protein